MAFKEIEKSTSVPDSPEKLLLDLPRRKIPNVLPHQQELMIAYAKHALNRPDVAMQLPTGSGKTLVGLLIAEWRRKKFNEKVVYLVPTKQLVNQVVEQAQDKYGLSVNGFTGQRKDYSPISKAEYKSASKVAITNYSSLFNTNPYFEDADVIIMDDVHAAENYVSALWSLRVERTKDEHKVLHTALCAILRPLIDPFNYTRITGELDSPLDRSWVDKIPTPDIIKIQNELREVFDTHTRGNDLSFPWSMIRDHLEACHIYLSSQEILVRPIIPPTWTLPVFEGAKQRIYMSATLGEGGDLERLVGRSSIYRLPIPAGWDKHGVGRRFFLFPDMTFDEKEVSDLRLEFMRQTERSLILVPNTNMKEEIKNNVEQKLGYKVFGAEDIEASKGPFIESTNATAIVANRYDGIDFPGEECRLLFIEGLPKAMNLQERFLMSRMTANALFNERIQTRVLQAIGRCTRSLEDYSAVVISGEELPDYLADPHRRKFFHPELQAELLFGIEQSRDIKKEDIVDNLKLFLANGSEWEKVNQQIVVMRKDLIQQAFPAMDELEKSVVHEVAYQKKIWQKDYESSLSSAEEVLKNIKGDEMRGYRALWHYLAGSAAWLAFSVSKNNSLDMKAKEEFSFARDNAIGIPWLVSLARYSGNEVSKEETDDTVIYCQIEKMESVLASLGTTYQRKYVMREKEILEGLSTRDPSNPKPFENAHKLLGEMLGFESGKQESEGSPDPWWVSSDSCIVFEDHANAEDEAVIDVAKARQVSSHPIWMREHVKMAENAKILPVLVTPSHKVKRTALIYLKDVSVWNLEEFKKWSSNALSVVRELRTSFTQAGDLEWRSNAAVLLRKNNLDSLSLINQLREKKAENILEEIT